MRINSVFLIEFIFYFTEICSISNVGQNSTTSPTRFDVALCTCFKCSSEASRGDIEDSSASVVGLPPRAPNPLNDDDIVDVVEPDVEEGSVHRNAGSDLDEED